MKLSPEEKAKYHGAAFKASENFSKLNASEDFKTMINNQMWYKGEKISKAKAAGKSVKELTDQEKFEFALQYIVKHADGLDDEVADFLKKIQDKTGMTPLQVVETIKQGYPHIKFDPASLSKALDEIEDTVKITKVINKTSESPALRAAKKYAEITAAARVADNVTDVGKKTSKINSFLSWALRSALYATQAGVQAKIRFINNTEKAGMEIYNDHIKAAINNAVSSGALGPGIGGLNPSKPLGIEPYKPGTKGKRANNPAYHRNISDGDDREQE